MKHRQLERAEAVEQVHGDEVGLSASRLNESAAAVDYQLVGKYRNGD
jgi:hypothetical protein